MLARVRIDRHPGPPLVLGSPRSHPAPAQRLYPRWGPAVGGGGLFLLCESAVPDKRVREVNVGQALTGPFDLIFIDADKTNYVNCYRRALDLLAPNGVILIGNTLWSGEVLKQPPPDEGTAAIQELNRMVVNDPRVTDVQVTIRDGILVVRRAIK